jgi:hypothetical protein
MILSNKKTVFTLSLFLCSNLFAQTNNETSNSSITVLQEISVQASTSSAGGGRLKRQ